MKQEQMIEAIYHGMIGMQSDVAELKEDMIEVKKDVADLKEDVSELKEDMIEVKKDVADLKEDMVEVKAEISDIRVDMDRMDSNMDRLDNNMNQLKILVETELRKNIQIIAEGHLDFNRKLDQAIAQKNEFELAQVRLGIVESKVTDLQSYVAEQKRLAEIKES